MCEIPPTTLSIPIWLDMYVDDTPRVLEWLSENYIPTMDQHGDCVGHERALCASILLGRSLVKVYLSTTHDHSS